MPDQDPEEQKLLAHVEASLIREFDRALDEPRLRAVAARSVQELRGARVREFIPLFAYRNARAHVIEMLRAS